MPKQTELRNLVKAMRFRLWFARTLRLIERGLWVGVGLFALCAVLHRFVHSLSLVYCTALALLPIALVGSIALIFRPPALDDVAWVSDRRADAKGLLLSAWELLSDGAGAADTVTRRYVLTQAARATSLWRARLLQTPLVSPPRHIVSLLVVVLTSSFLLLSPGAESVAAKPRVPEAASAAISAADHSVADAASRLQQRLVASLEVPGGDHSSERAVRQEQPQARGQSVAHASDDDSADLADAAEAGSPMAVGAAADAAETALAKEWDQRNQGPLATGTGAGADGDLPGTALALGPGDEAPLGPDRLKMRYVELERARFDENSVGANRIGVEFDSGSSWPATAHSASGIAQAAQYAHTPLAATLPPAMGRYVADYFSALRK